MHSEIAIGVLCVVFFALIQAIELISFLARAAGIYADKKATAFMLQSAIFTFTRAFILFLLPLLGFLVDTGWDVLALASLSLAAHAASGLAGFLIILLYPRLIGAFVETIADFHSKRRLLRSLLSWPQKVLTARVDQEFTVARGSIDRHVFAWSAVVFFVYGASIFFVFIVAAQFHDYRATFTQLSGAFNASAAMILTFYIEPKLSLSADSSGSSEEGYTMVMSLLFGRIFGVGVLGSTLFLALVISSTLP